MIRKLISVSQLGVTGSIGDTSFEKGQLSRASFLGDTGVTGADGSFIPAWLDAFKGEIDGVFLVCPFLFNLGVLVIE